MTDTFAGKVISLRAVQFSKAPAYFWNAYSPPIVSNAELSGKITFSKATHFLNAAGHIFLTLAGILICCRFAQSANAPNAL